MASGATKDRPVLADDPTSIDVDPEARRARLVGRRAVLGRASPLVRTLQRDHEQLAAAIDRLRATDAGPERDALWNDVFAGVTAHAQAERTVLYVRLAGDERAREAVERSFDGNGVLEDLLLGIDGIDDGDPRLEDRLEDLRRAFADHVREDEEAILLLADRILEPLELEALEVRFLQRRTEIEREIALLRGRTSR
jgi:hypothetical protein